MKITFDDEKIYPHKKVKYNKKGYCVEELKGLSRIEIYYDIVELTELKEKDCILTKDNVEGFVINIGRTLSGQSYVDIWFSNFAIGKRILPSYIKRYYFLENQKTLFKKVYSRTHAFEAVKIRNDGIYQLRKR